MIINNKKEKIALEYFLNNQDYRTKSCYTKLLEWFIKNDISLNNKQMKALQESFLFNEKDIYWNKDKFNSGEINLCFITGLSGSGKSTMAHKLEGRNIEAYELDDLLCIKKHFTMDNLKEYGDLIYSYFNGIGKRWYVDDKELDYKAKYEWNGHYEDIMIPEFVHYAMKYAKVHRDKKFILEGVWLYDSDWFKPEEFKDYAVFIKGTSLVISHIRASRRDSQDAGDRLHKGLAFVKNISNIHQWKWYFINENSVNKWRTYYTNLIKKKKR